MAIFNFKGQVKVADVQAAFDELIERINNIVDTYNTTDAFLQDQDYSTGGDSLGAAGYTLTIGGIKQVMAAYNGTLIGCRIFRLSNNTIVTTDGVYITSSRIINIPSQILTGTGSVVCINLTTGEVVRGSDGDNPPEGTVPICYLTQTGTDTYMNVHRGVQLEELKGYKITIPNRDMSFYIEGDDTSSHRFQGAGVYTVNEGRPFGGFYWFEPGLPTNLAEGNAPGGGGWYRQHCSALPFNPLFIPKGCGTPIWSWDGRNPSRTNYTCKLQRG